MLHVELQPRAILLDVHETRLAHAADGLDAPGDASARISGTSSSAVLSPKFAQHVRNRLREIEALAEGHVSQRFDLAHARRALLKQFVFQRQYSLLWGNPLL